MPYHGYPIGTVILFRMHLFFHLPHCQVPILHLGEVRQAWSSHPAQGCYMVSQLAAVRFKPMTSAFKVPHAIHLVTMSPQLNNLCTTYVNCYMYDAVQPESIEYREVT